MQRRLKIAWWQKRVFCSHESLLLGFAGLERVFSFIMCPLYDDIRLTCSWCFAVQVSEHGESVLLFWFVHMQFHNVLEISECCVWPERYASLSLSLSLSGWVWETRIPRLFLVKFFMAEINQSAQMRMKVQIQGMQPIQSACDCWGNVGGGWFRFKELIDRLSFSRPYNG